MRGEEPARWLGAAELDGLIVPESITEIHNYRQASADLATSGQPREEQLGPIAAAGYDVIINLALHDDPRYSLRDEAGRSRPSASSMSTFRFASMRRVESTWSGSSTRWTAARIAACGCTALRKSA